MDMSEKQEKFYDTAKGILENLLSLMGLSATVTLSDAFTTPEEEGQAGSIGLNIEGEDLGILIGRRGQTIASLQHIVRLMTACKMQDSIPIVVDVEDYKNRRCEALRVLAENLAEQVVATHTPFAMEPISAFERRIVHLALANHPRVATISVGEGETRKIVISLK